MTSYGERDPALLARLVDQLPGMVAYWSADLRLVLANSAYRDFVGREAGEMLGRHFSDVLGPDLFRANFPHLHTALGGTPALFDRTLSDGSGSERHVGVAYVPDVVDGTVEGVFALITDITERIQAQRDLDEAQRLGGHASWTYRPGDGVFSWSRHLHRLAGQDPDKDPADWSVYLRMVHPEDLAVIESVRDHVERGVAHEARYRLVVGGVVRHVHSRSAPTMDRQGRVVMRGTVQDETELREQANALTASNRRHSDLVAMVGHDVRQPLSVVMLHLDAALLDWSDDGSERSRRSRASVEKALAASSRMNDLLSNILAMVNVESGAIVVRAERTGLAELLTRMLGRERFGADVTLDVQSDAPVDVDPFHVDQIVSNLVANAGRHGAPPVTIVIEADDVTVRMRVRDAGPGVPDDFVPHLFDRFARPPASTSTSSGPGSGFGLYMVRELVQANGGTTDHRPVLPHGAEFVVEFPRAVSEITAGPL